MVYAAAFVGADWNWGVLRNVIARGESRSSYLLAKAAAIGDRAGHRVCSSSSRPAFVLIYVRSFDRPACPSAIRSARHGADGPAPISSSSASASCFERAAIGFAVAVVLRSQLAGAVVGIVLFLGESVVTAILTVISMSRVYGGRLRAAEPAARCRVVPVPAHQHRRQRLQRAARARRRRRLRRRHSARSMLLTRAAAQSPCRCC